MNINSFGSKMIISEYRGYMDIDVYFPEYNWTFEHAIYQSFKNGNIKCPYERRCYGKGYLGEGKYKMSEKCNKSRGKDPIGVSPTSSCNYQVNCSNGYGKYIYLGSYSTKEEAFQVYKQYKEKVIKETIDSYEGKIPEPYYSRLKTAMYNYEVEIDD